jgi:cobyrinic acid a,c-diamide synthase
MNRLLISAAHKSSGKTTISIGLCRALTQQGSKVQAFKKGPDYIDPMWLGRASGRPCYNLDFYTMQHAEILTRLQHHSADADLSLIEGNKGLYDGLDLEGSNSNAALARLTRTPVILVIDVQGMTRGIAPLVLGYQAFEPELNIAGIILNQVRGQRHEGKLQAVLEHYTDVPVVGAVFHDPSMVIDERHLGLVPSNENREAEQRIDYIGQKIGAQVNLDTLRALAASAPALPEAAPPQAATLPSPDVTLAIAQDAAFGFYYPDDLEALQAAGARLVPFSPLVDPALPACDGLFLGGGFPETQMQALAANSAMRQSVRAAIEQGLPTYAECGGLMYLARSLQWRGQTSDMVGVVPGDIRMHDRPVGRGYVRLQETACHPWPTEQTDTSADFPAHEFHYSALENLPGDLDYAYQVRRGMGIDGAHDGLVINNLLASYSHLRDTSYHHWARRFVQFVRSRRANSHV